MSLFQTRYRPGPGPSKVINGVLFNLSWLAILMTQSSIIAPVIVAVYLLVHFAVIGNGKAELLLIAAVTAMGGVLDQLLFLAGLFNLEGAAATAPLWLTCLWPVFATTLLHAFKPFRTRLYFAAALGAVGGTLSYVAGVRLSVIDFGSPFWGPVLIGLLWSIIFPLLLKLSIRFDSPGDLQQTSELADRRAFD